MASRSVLAFEKDFASFVEQLLDAKDDGYIDHNAALPTKVVTIC